MARTVADTMGGRLVDGRYRVGPRIARGGMATVYEATDIRLERLVALKVMHPGLGDDDDFGTRFVREARSAARLSHPHVVGVFDQGDDDGTLFLAMEYIPGHTLRDEIRAGAPMSSPNALALLDPILSALSAAHHAGMIHRDVKPENVLIADDGRIKVADFGLARAISAETQHTATRGVLIGTVSYLSPELVVDGRADARSDVYAAGVLLYELLTGRKPHEGDSPIQVAYKHVHEDVPPPSRTQPGIPAYVDALVARATARDRFLRPADAGVLLHQVRRVRAALDHGVSDDPELTADLTPNLGWAGTDDGSGNEDTAVIDRGSTEGTPSETQGARRSRRGPILLALVLLLAAVAGVAAWYFGVARYTTTPAVINLSQSQAREKVAASGLAFAVARREFSETVAPGTVIGTEPEAGSRILESGGVVAVLSKGPERYELPALRGLSGSQARAELQRVKAEPGDTLRRFHPTVAEGVVLSSTPRAGTQLKPGAAVDVTLSRGPRPIEVPDLTGRDAVRAEEVLAGRGFEVEVSREHSAEVPEGEVMSQSPRSGTLFRAGTVAITVSEGPVLVEVPSVAGMGVDEATATIEQSGFEVRTQQSQLYVGLEYVVDTDPAEGSRVPEGSTITLYLV